MGGQMNRQLFVFFKANDGAVTVDWVVLTAAVGFIAVAAFVAVKQETLELSTSVGVAIPQKVEGFGN